MNINKLCEEIISDITGKSTISGILLKTQLLAATIGPEEFRKWVDNEQNGYEKPLEVPDYRKMRCNVTALVSIPFHSGQTEMNVPIDVIQPEGAREMLSTIFYARPAIEAERIAANSNKGIVRNPTPAMGHQYVQPLFPVANVETIYQDLTPSMFASLVETVKSKILSFILQLNKAGEIQLSLDKPTNKDNISKIFIQTINGSVINNGDGNIDADNIILLSNDTVSESDIQKLKTMFSRLNVLIRNENDPIMKEAAATLNTELQTVSPSKSVLKKGLAIIKGLAMGVTSSEIATIINAALGILQ